jgi:hypothetical protein
MPAARWGDAAQIVWAGIHTIPASPVIAAVSFGVIRLNSRLS